MRADLASFITTLRQHRESRTGPGLYASDKVFGLLEAYEAIAADLETFMDRPIEHIKYMSGQEVFGVMNDRVAAFLRGQEGGVE